MSELVPETPVEPGAEPAAEPWSLTQDEWTQFQQQQEQLANAVGSLAQLEQQRAAVYQPQNPPDGSADWDPYDPNRVRELIRTEMAPFAQTQQIVTEAQWQDTIADVMEDVASRGGDFDRNVAEAFALQLLPQEMQRAGGDRMRALEATLEQAAQRAREFEKKVADAAIARYTNQVSTLAGAPAEPGSSYAQGVEQRVVPDWRKDRGSVTDRFFADSAA